MTDQQQALLECLTDYLTAECSAARRADVERLLRESPEAVALLSDMRAAYGRVPAVQDTDIADTIVRKVENAIGVTKKTVSRQGTLSFPVARAHGPVGERPMRWPTVRHSGWWGLGSIAVAIIAAVALAYQTSRPPARTPRVYTTKTGQQATVTLDDGTKMILAPRTTVQLLAYGPRARKLALDGEVYFDVARSSGAPFIVQTGTVLTRVLGTQFVVQRYAGSEHVRVAVRQGKVAVSDQTAQRASVTLTSGWAADVTDSSTTATAISDDAQYTGWMDGRLVFYLTPAREVFSTLTRWYGYRFQFADSSLAEQKLTAVVSTQSSAAALTTLKLLLNVDLAFDGDVVTLKLRRRATGPSVAPLRGHPSDLTHSQNEVGR